MSTRVKIPGWLNLWIALVLILTLFNPALGLAQAQDMKDFSNRTDQSAQLTKKLLDEFEQNEYVTFLVKFKETVDADEFVQVFNKKQELKFLTEDEKQLSLHAELIKELQSTSAKEQRSVINYLKNEEKKGKAKNLESFFIVNGLLVTATKEVAEKLLTFPEVEKILPDEERKIHVSKTEDKNVIQDNPSIEWNVSQVKAPEVWEKGIDGEGVVVAVIDTGVQWDHPALKEKYRGYDSTTGEVNHAYSWYDATTVGALEPVDLDGHGTHVTGTIVGAEADGSNQIGVAPGAKFVSVRAFVGDTGSDSALIRAAQWVLQPTDENGNVDLTMKPDIVNNSWAGGPGLDEWYRNIVKTWRAADIFPQFAAGNTTYYNLGGPFSIAAPANYPESFATGAVDSNNQVASFSLRGPSPYGEIKPDISAPGVNIRSSVPGGTYEGGWNGTSMAAPALSGVIALVKELAPNLEISDIELLLKQTAVPLKDDEYVDSPNDGYGYGLVDAEAIISMLLDGVGIIEGSVTNEAGEILEDAKVSISPVTWETGLNLETNKFRLVHPAGEVKLTVEAYGHYKKEETLSLLKDSVTNVNIVLSEIPKQEVTGKVISASTNQPLANIKIGLLNDPKTEEVLTDEEGNYKLEVYHGDHTIVANGWQYQLSKEEVKVANQPINLDFTLETEYKYAGEELAYDDGSDESYEYSSVSDSSWAVRMSIEEGKERAYVTEGRFFLEMLYNKKDPSEFRVEIWDASGKNQSPGKKLFGPIQVKEELERGQQWVHVDLRDYRIQVDGDFYLVYVQEGTSYDVPQVAVDLDGLGTGRSYFYSPSSGWEDRPALGNFMFRSVVSYDVDDPVLINPEGDLYTNEPFLQIEGIASPTTKAILYQNEKLVQELVVNESGEFFFETKLEDGENVFSVTSSFLGDSFANTSSLAVVYDTLAPTLKVNSPEDGRFTNKEVATITGEVDDNYGLKSLSVAGELVEVIDGKFTKKILLDEGTNTISVKAEDLAGNTSEEIVTIHYNYEEALIDELVPQVDQYVRSGDLVKISFKSNITNGKASYVITLPNGLQANMEKNKLVETAPGLYEGEWLAPDHIKLQGAIVEVQIEDQFGNQSSAQAQGKIYVNKVGEVERIKGTSRYDTAVEISRKGWKTADVVVLARSDDFADSLAGVPLAYQLNAPILLTHPNYLPEVTLEEIKRLQASKVIILGGSLAISDQILEDLKLEKLDVERIFGKTRSLTAQAIAERLVAEGSKEAIIVNQWDFPDALSIASYAAKKQMPIFLSDSRKLSHELQESLERLGVEKTYVVGGKLAVSDELMNQLPNPVRISGTDRVGTNIAVHKFFSYDQEDIFVATGEDFADALTGAVLAAKKDQAILLIRKALSEEATNFLQDLKLVNLTILGGEVAVSPEIEESLKELLQ